MNRIRSKWKFLLIVLFISCYPKEKAPILDFEEQLIIDILTDLHIAQAVVKKFPLQKRDSVNKVYKGQIAQVYEINELDLDSLICTLESYPEFYYEINGKVLENIQELENKVLEAESSKKSEIIK